MNDQLVNGCLASLEEEDYQIEWVDCDEDAIFEEFEKHIKEVYNEK